MILSCSGRFLGGIRGELEGRRGGGVLFFWAGMYVRGRRYRPGKDTGRQRDVASIRAGLRETGRKPGARGRGYRPGQGLRRGIQLRFREMAKTIAAGPELAAGSNS